MRQELVQTFVILLRFLGSMSLEPLFEQAQSEQLWFYHESDETGEIWASPQYLRQMHEQDKMIWAPEHWDLRSPVDYLKNVHEKAENLIEEYNELARQLNFPAVLLLEKQDMTPVQ